MAPTHLAECALQTPSVPISRRSWASIGPVHEANRVGSGHGRSPDGSAASSSAP
jgi:hypothetical protein